MEDSGQAGDVWVDRPNEEDVLLELERRVKSALDRDESVEPAFRWAVSEARIGDVIAAVFSSRSKVIARVSVEICEACQARQTLVFFVSRVEIPERIALGSRTCACGRRIEFAIRGSEKDPHVPDWSVKCGESLRWHCWSDET